MSDSARPSAKPRASARSSAGPRQSARPSKRDDERAHLLDASQDSGPYDVGLNFHEAMHKTILYKDARERYKENYTGCKKCCCGCPF